MNVTRIINNYHVDIFSFYVLSVCNVILLNPTLSSQKTQCIFGIANALVLVAIHAFSKYYDRVEDSLNNQAFPERQYPLLLVISLSLFAISTFLYFLLPSLFASVGVVFIVIGILYSYPSPFRIKNILFLKNIFPASIWFLSLQMLVSLSYPGVSLMTLCLLNASVFLLFLSFEIMWDMPDAVGDRSRGVKTIPNTFGFTVAKSIILALTLFVLLTSPHVVNQVIALVIAIGSLLANPTHQKDYYHVCMYVIVFVAFLNLWL